MDQSSMKLEPVQLEALAETFQEQMQNGMVKDRHFRSRTVTMAFLGGEAVTVLLRLLEEADDPSAGGVGQGMVITREQALYVGREIEKMFPNFFIHTKTTAKKVYQLEDCDKDLYHFQNNLPIQVYKAKKQYPSWWDKANLLTATIQVKPHNIGGRFKTYPDSFYGRDAVNCLMDLKLVRSRGEAVYLMGKINEKVGFCKPVTSFSNKNSDGTDDITDDKQLYQMIPLDERKPEPPKRTTSLRRRTTGNRGSKSSSSSPPQ